MKLGIDVVIDDHHKITRPELVSLGNHVAIDWGFYCTTQLEIGDYVHVSPYVAVIGGSKGSLTVGDFCFISLGARIVCGSEEMHGQGLIGPLINRRYRDTVCYDPVILEAFSGVCAGSTVMPGVRMAQGSILGANSLLKHNTEPWTIYVGSPAKPISNRRSDLMIAYAKELGYDY